MVYSMTNGRLLQRWFILFFAGLLVIATVYMSYMKMQEPEHTYIGATATSTKAAFIAMRDMWASAPDNKDVDIQISVLTYNRPQSLQRLLESLNKATYDGDIPALDIFIDRLKTGITDKETYNVAQRFTFIHGPKRIHIHKVNGGMSGQWHGCWRPSESSTELGLILEDDITVSPYFYRWLKAAGIKYQNYSEISGFTLMGRIIHGHKVVNDKNGVKLVPQGGFLRAPKPHNVLLHKVVGTWGFSPKRDKWRQYLDWYDNLDDAIDYLDPRVPGIIPYQSFLEHRRLKKPEGMWEMFYIYYMRTKGEYTLYVSNPGYLGFTTNWMEAGVHYTGNDTNQYYTENDPSPLVMKWDDKYINFPDTPIRLNYDGTVQNVSHVHPKH